VAGCDYAYEDYPKHVPPIPFYEFCTNRVKLLKKSDPTLTFTLFDVKSGFVRESKLNSEGKRINFGSSDYEAVTDAPPHYIDSKTGRKRHEFNQEAKNNIMSIVDIYEFIQKIGERKETAGSVIELSIFSHAHTGGPVLVNSYERHTKTNKRDPTDKDGRKKDFEPENITEVQLKQFKDAFHKNAFVWLWGCQFGKGYNRVMYQTIEHREYRKTSPNQFAGLPIQFKFTGEEAFDAYHLDTDFFPPEPGDFNKKIYQLEFTKSGQQVKDFFKKAHENTYCSVIANKLKINCYGAFMATYAEDENKMTKKPAYPLMRIPRREFPKAKKAKYPEDFSRHIEFFTKHLHYKKAPEDRGYGTYEPK
jgi:hypothetical protein